MVLEWRGLLNPIPLRLAFSGQEDKEKDLWKNFKLLLMVVVEWEERLWEKGVLGVVLVEEGGMMVLDTELGLTWGRGLVGRVEGRKVWGEGEDLEDNMGMEAPEE